MNDTGTLFVALAAVGLTALAADHLSSPRSGMGHLAGGGSGVRDEFIKGPHSDYIIGEEGWEKLHLGPGGGWVEPLLPPMGPKGRNIDYSRKGKTWKVTVREGTRVIGEGTAGSPADAGTLAIRRAGARRLARGGRAVLPPAGRRSRRATGGEAEGVPSRARHVGQHLLQIVAPLHPGVAIASATMNEAHGPEYGHTHNRR